MNNFNTVNDLSLPGYSAMRIHNLLDSLVLKVVPVAQDIASVTVDCGVNRYTLQRYDGPMGDTPPGSYPLYFEGVLLFDMNEFLVLGLNQDKSIHTAFLARDKYKDDLLRDFGIFN